MPQKNIMNIISGASKLARKASGTIKSSSTKLLEENILKGQYVTREEFNQLQKQLDKLQKDVAKLQE